MNRDRKHTLLLLTTGSSTGAGGDKCRNPEAGGGSEKRGKTMGLGMDGEKIQRGNIGYLL